VRYTANILDRALPPAGKKYIFFQLDFLQEAGRRLRRSSRTGYTEVEAFMMAPAPACARFRFYAELNDHLPPGKQYRMVEKQFFVPASVKDMIEDIGVPHAEVDLILLNGESSDFTRLIRNGDRVAV
jgi:hypothetical protein